MSNLSQRKPEIVDYPIVVNQTDTPLEQLTGWQRHRHRLTGLLCSIVSHLIMCLVLLWIAYSTYPPPQKISITSAIEAEASIHEQPIDIEPNLVEVDTEPVEEVSETEQAFLANQLDQLANQAIIDPSANQPDDPAAVASEDAETGTIIKTMPIGGGLEGRTPQARALLAMRQGGSPESEQAVEMGLKWIVNHQQQDGGWGFKHRRVGDCDCANEGLRESKTGATGLALLAILGAGYTHQTGPYQEQVGRGLRFLTKNMRVNGGWLGDNDKMYSHAIATLALAEAYQLTGDERLRESINRSLQYIKAAQNKNDGLRQGSWGYEPGQPGDLTVTGWFLMALKSCQNAGLNVDPETWELTRRFVDAMSTSEGVFGYTSPSNPTDATVAIGLLCKINQGLHRESGLLTDGGDFLSIRGPSQSDIYYNYYATQVLFHRQGEDWHLWNGKLRDYLIRTQQQGNGHNHGSWYFPDPHGQVGGRLYTTAMAVMTLEVYYRYLPFYESLTLD